MERREVIDKMVDHCYRKSISDTLSKILHFENYLQNDPVDEDTKNDMNDTRNGIMADIFSKIAINNDNDELAPIYYFITGLFDPTNIEEEKALFTEIIENKRIMRPLITKPFHGLDLITCTDGNFDKIINRRKNFSDIIDIIIFFLTNIKKLKIDGPTCDSDSKLCIKHTAISNELFDVLSFLIKNNFNKKNNDEKEILHSFNECKKKPLGEFKIKIVELLDNLVPYFSKISKFFDEILIETDFFKYAFEYLYEYEWNNIYQESLLSLLKSLLNDADFHTTLQEYLFNDLKIFEIIKNHTNLDEKFKFSNEVSIPITHGYYSFFIDLSYKINTVIGGTPVKVKNNLAKQGSFSFIPKNTVEGDKKAAMGMLYGGFDDFDSNQNNENDKEKEKEEEDKYHYDSMKKYITDEWRDYFGLNIEDVIKQYENNEWPEQSEKKQSDDLPFARAREDNPENNNEDNEMNKRGNNMFDYEDEGGDDKFEDRGRAGVMGDLCGDEENNNNDNNEDVFKQNDINVDAFEFDDNKDDNNDKVNDNDNPFKNQNENDFEFDDKKEDEKEKKSENNENDKKDEKKPEEVKDNKTEEEKKEEGEKKDDNKKDEEKTNVDEKKDTKEENKTEEKKDGEENKGEVEVKK